jgi:hypothetical protein
MTLDDLVGNAFVRVGLSLTPSAHGTSLPTPFNTSESLDWYHC